MTGSAAGKAPRLALPLWANGAAGTKGGPPIVKAAHEACTPRKEVLSGKIREDIFAAKLGDVVARKGPDVYRDADVFFQNTFPTAGLQVLLKEIFTRLAGGAGSPFIRLETSFGGGKTHDLIAAYHVARNGERIASLDGFVPSKLVPIRILVCTDAASEGLKRMTQRSSFVSR